MSETPASYEVATHAPKTPPVNAGDGRTWFVSFSEDQRGLGRWSGPHSSQREAMEAANELEHLGFASHVWSETEQEREQCDRRQAAAIERYLEKLQRMRAALIGRCIGEGMAHDAITDGLPGVWPGFDVFDGVDLSCNSIEPDTEAWRVAERSARYSFARCYAKLAAQTQSHATTDEAAAGHGMD